MQIGDEPSAFLSNGERYGCYTHLLESKSASIRLQTSELVLRWPCWRLLSCRLHQRPQSKFRLLILSATFDTVDHSAINLSRGPDWNKESHSRRPADIPMIRSQKMTDRAAQPPQMASLVGLQWDWTGIPSTQYAHQASGRNWEMLWNMILVECKEHSSLHLCSINLDRACGLLPLTNWKSEGSWNEDKIPLAPVQSAQNQNAANNGGGT